MKGWKTLVGVDSGDFLLRTDFNSLTNKIWMIFNMYIPDALWDVYAALYAKYLKEGKQFFIPEGPVRNEIKGADALAVTIAPAVENNTVIVFTAPSGGVPRKRHERSELQTAIIKPYYDMMVFLGAKYFYLNWSTSMVVGYETPRKKTMKGCVCAVMAIRNPQPGENYNDL